MKNGKLYINDEIPGTTTYFEKWLISAELITLQYEVIEQMRNGAIDCEMQLTSDSFKSVSEQLGLKNYNNKKIRKEKPYYRKFSKGKF